MQINSYAMDLRVSSWEAPPSNNFMHRPIHWDIGLSWDIKDGRKIYIRGLSLAHAPQISLVKTLSGQSLGMSILRPSSLYIFPWTSSRRCTVSNRTSALSHCCNGLYWTFPQPCSVCFTAWHRGTLTEQLIHSMSMSYVPRVGKVGIGASFLQGDCSMCNASVTEYLVAYAFC